MAPSKVNRLHPVVIPADRRIENSRYLDRLKNYKASVIDPKAEELLGLVLNKMTKLEERDGIGKHLSRGLGGITASLFEPHIWIFESLALIQRPSGTFYSGTGCCAGACELHTSRDTGGYGTVAYYYIPVVRELSKKKVYTYLRELQGILSGIVNISGPFKTKGIEFRDARGYARADSFFAQQTDGDIDYYIVECRVTNHRKSLLYWLDFFRPIYGAFQACFSARTHHSFDSFILFYYNQPRLYFKLCKLFPKLPKHYCLYLSYVISGADVSQTYYPWANYKYGPNARFTRPIVQPISSINEYCASNYGKTTNAFPSERLQMISNFLDMTPQSLKENILIIDTLHKLDLTKYL